MYLSEISPARWRGTLNLFFQAFTIFGIVAAACINYGTVRSNWGWRLSLGLAAIPGIILGIGALFLPDSPNSLVFRGKVEEGRRVLENYRGQSSMHKVCIYSIHMHLHAYAFMMHNMALSKQVSNWQSM